ncbi:MAG: Na+/H+ antiporter subunit E [Gemmatimonadetes bacterium]|nr:Na+/H+ antiporter subunit E [Gemmatimonadota bacterium]
MRHAIALTVVFAGIWLLWSGHLEALLLSLGALSCIVAVALAARMRILDDEGVPFALAGRAARYLPWLLLQIVKANIDVARRILNPRLPVAPRLIRVHARQQSAVGRALFANSITLTPGTVSVDVDGETIVVHALTAEAGNDVLAGEMNRRVVWVEQGS